MTVATVARLLLAFANPSTPPVPLDTLVEVDGYRLHLVVHRGTKPLTIVMESGGGATLAAWSGVDSLVAARTGATVVTYDRAGFGGSETGPGDLTPQRQVEHIDRALEKLKTPPTRIVVGTSYGGLMAVLHAHRFRGKTRGLVLVDAMNPRFVTATGEFIYSTVPRIERPVTKRDTALARLVSTFDTVIHDPRASDVGLGIPIVVITAGEGWLGNATADQAWRASHEAIAAAASGRRLVVADRSKHDIARSRPDTIIDAVVALAIE
jgi:pimeloyl-ACP methyl ester carboxylesterase